MKQCGSVFGNTTSELQRELTWLRCLPGLSRRLAAENDPMRILPAILDLAIEATGAERGVLVRLVPDLASVSLQIEASRTRSRTGGPQRKPSWIPRQIVERVLHRGEEILTSPMAGAVPSEGSGGGTKVSIACVPVKLRGRLLGALYLDRAWDTGTFTESDLPAARAFANKLALVLERAALLGREPESPTEKNLIPRVRVPAPASSSRFGRLVGVSQSMQRLYEEIQRAADRDSPVLIQGEPGTGKSLVARELHDRSAGKGSPFLSLNCSTWSESDLERALMGSEESLGDIEGRGAFLRAEAGALLLESVHALSPATQAEVVRVLTERRVLPGRMGSSEEVRCRVISTTDRDLFSAVQEGGMRGDLYYRLDVIRLFVPPLRERTDDIPLLMGSFLAEMKEPRLTLTEGAMNLMKDYSWPGNLLELRNEVKRLASLREVRIGTNHLSPEIREGRSADTMKSCLGPITLAQVKRHMLQTALRTAGGNKTQAAKQLGVPRSSLYHLLRKYGVS